MNNKKKASKTQQNSKLRFRHLIVSNWYVFVISIAVLVGLTFAYLQVTPPLYEVTTTVLLKQAPEEEDDKVWIEAQMNEISSEKLIKQTVASYHDGVSYYISDPRLPEFLQDFTRKEVDRFPFSIQVKDASTDFYDIPLVIEVLQGDQYRLVPDADSMKPGAPTTFEGSFGKPLTTDNFRLQIDRNEKVDLLTDQQYAFVLNSTTKLVRRYAVSLNAAPVKVEGTPVELLKLVLNTSNFKDGVDFLNQHIRQYEKNKRAGTTGQVPEKVQTLDNNIRLLQDSISRIEKILLQLKNDTVGTRINADTKNKQNSFFAALSTSQKKIAAYRSLKNSLLRGEEKSKAELLPLVDDEDVESRKWLDAYFQNLEDLDKLLLSVTENHPTAIRLLRQVEKSRERLVQYANIFIDAEQEKSEALRKRLAYLNRTGQQVEQVVNLEDSLQSVARTFASLNNTLKALQNERAGAQNLLARDEILEIVSAPETSSREPVWPSDYLYLLAVLLGTLVALFIIRTTKAGKSDFITDQKELISNSKAPLLGMISNGSKNLRLIAREAGNSPIAQSFKFIGLNLSYISQKGNCNVVGITSSVGGEGSTFCSVNLAATLAQEGNKTLLLSLDQGSTALDEYLNIKHLGLAEHIMDFAPLDRILQHAELQNLDVITPGNLDYLSGYEAYEPKVAHIVKSTRQHYDYILIKTPPITKSSLHFTLAQLFDINLFLVRHNYTRKGMLGGINNMYGNKKIRNLYLLFNDVKFAGQQELATKLIKGAEKLPEKEALRKEPMQPSSGISSVTPIHANTKNKQKSQAQQESRARSSQTDQLMAEKERKLPLKPEKAALVKNKDSAQQDFVFPQEPTHKAAPPDKAHTENKKEPDAPAGQEQKPVNASTYSPEQKAGSVQKASNQPELTLEKQSEPKQQQKQNELTVQERTQDENFPSLRNKKEKQPFPPPIRPNPLREEIERKRKAQLKREKRGEGEKTEKEKNQKQLDDQQMLAGPLIPKKDMAQNQEKEEKKQDDNFIPPGTILPHEEYEEPGFFNRLFGKKKKKKTVYKNPFA